MKRRILSIFVILAMILTLVPSISLMASAEEAFTEVIAYKNSKTAESEHFILNGEPLGNCWLIERYTIAGHDLTITAKDPNTVILSIEAVVPGYGWRYNEISYSSGEKLETGSVEDGSTVHVNNINSNKLVITGCYGDFWIKDFTIRFTHRHNFTGRSKDNGDGTHSRKCSTPDCLVYGDPEEHTYKPVERAGDDPLIFKAKCTDCTSTINNYRIENKSFTYTNSTTYGDVEKGETLRGGTKLKANYSFGDAEMIVYVDGDKVADVKDGEYWIAKQCVECVNFDTNWFSSEPLKIWFKSLCSYTMATCESPETCMYCGFTRGDALGHTWEDATCTTLKTCSVCGKTDGDEFSHVWNDGEVTTPATLTEEGVKTYTCEKCGAVKTEIIPKNVPYVYYTVENNVAVKHDGICKEYEIVTETVTKFEDGKWYVVKGDVTNENRIEVLGTANLILTDGCTLTLTRGIRNKNVNTLNIYGQSGDSGKLIANGQNNAAGIGGNDYGSGGNVTVHGGNVNATGGDYGAGIGGGLFGNGGNVTIYGGVVTAVGTKDATAIGKGGGGEAWMTHGTVTVANYMCIKGGENKDSLAIISKVGYEKYIIIDNSLNPEAINLTEGKAYAQKDKDNATMRFMWKIEATEEANITNIGAYVIPFDKFDDIATDDRTKSVQYVNPKASDGQALKSGNTFAVDVTNIPTAKYDTMIWAMPFVNGSVIANQLLNATVNGADINK